MRTIAVLACLLAVALPSAADKRVDDAIARAQSQLEKGKPDDALKTMEKLASQQPDSPEALAALARLQVRLGKMEDAAASARKAVEVSNGAPGPARADALVTLSTLDVLHGASADAVAHARQAVQLQESPASLSALAVAQARARDATAVATAEKAVQIAPRSAEAQSALGEAQLSAGRHDQATAAFRKALELDPKLTAARVGVARALLESGKAVEAEQEARKATEEDPNSGEAFAVHGLTILAKDGKNWGDAIAQAQQGAFLHPNNALVAMAVGRIFEASGNLEQAANNYRRALKADPKYVDARAALIQAQVRRGELDPALVEARKLAEEAPNSGEAQLTLGRLLLRKNEFVEAVAPLEKAAAALPGSAEAHALLGTAYQYTRQSDDALGAYRKAVELAPQNMVYRSTYGLLLGLNQQYDAGVAELKKVVASPGYVDTAGFTNLGWIYRNMEPPQPQEAVQAYNKALQIDPKNAQAALGLGWSYSYLKEHDQAIAAFQKAVALDPATAGEAYYGIAWGHFFKKDMAQAKAVAEKARAEGRNVASLLDNVDKFEKGQAMAAEQAERQFRAAQREVDVSAGLGESSRNLMRGSSAAKKAAAAALVKHGAQAVSFLIYAAVHDPDFGVRSAALSALGAIGAPARGQCPQIKQIGFGPNPYQSTISDQIAKEVAYEEVRKDARNAAARIGCN